MFFFFYLYSVCLLLKSLLYVLKHSFSSNFQDKFAKLNNAIAKLERQKVDLSNYNSNWTKPGFVYSSIMYSDPLVNCILSI